MNSQFQGTSSTDGVRLDSRLVRLYQWSSQSNRLRIGRAKEDVSTILQIKLHNATSPNLLPVVLTFSSQEEAKGSINVDVLLATGCLAGDFVARQIVDKYDIKPVLQPTAKLSVYRGLDNTCYDISKSVIISVDYFDERLNNTNTFEIKVINIDASPLDLIIGRATIKKLV